MKVSTFLFLAALLVIPSLQRGCKKNQIQIGTTCVCISGYYRDTAGKCKQCPLDSYVSADQSTCICLTGYFDQGTGKCITKCGVGQHFINGKCLCVGYITAAGICQPCPVIATPSPDQTTCVCPDNMLFSPGYNVCYINCPLGINMMCNCPVGYFNFLGTYCIK